MVNVLAAASAYADANVKRYLLSAGANNGGKDRVMLRYAVTDANAFASVFIEMGGVEKNNSLIIANPSSRELLGGIANLGKLIAGDKAAEAGVRSEVFVYYSGHADDIGLKLNGETLAWADFRAAVNKLDADVRVAVLDACGSGAITRTKGGIARPAFLSDASSNMKGYAFLTSSNENESSQESDRIKGSYFTHALLSGMRGAADMTGDGKVTINEAYQYAFSETLQNTQNTKAGTQHPSRDMNLAGTGDIVMTDLRQTSATLSLDVNIEGRFFIRDGSGNLFAELRKIRGRAIELGMPPGRYSIQMEAPSKVWMANDIVIIEGEKTVLTMNDMKAIDKQAGTVARGDGDDGDDTYDDDGAAADTAESDLSGDSVMPDGQVEPDGLASSVDSTKPAAAPDSSMQSKTPPDDSSASKAVVVANPLLDSACRVPYRLNSGIVVARSTVPESGIQLSLLVNTANAEFCGTQLSFVANVAAKDMNGMQINPTLNISSGHLIGLQVGSFNLSNGGIDGLQVGVINFAKGDISQLQAGHINMAMGSAGLVQGGMVNLAKRVEYLQGGAVNVVGTVGYVQGGMVNAARRVGYVQGGMVNLLDSTGYFQFGAVNVAQYTGYVGVQAGTVNVAGNIGYVQAGTVNIGKKVGRDIDGVDSSGLKYGMNYGYQIGTVNVAGKVGRQVGLVNIAGYSDRTPIGLINVIGNGIFDGTLYADACGDMGVSLHTGTSWLYTVLEFQQPFVWDNWPKTWGHGLGTRFGMNGKFFVNMDATWSRSYYYIAGYDKEEVVPVPPENVKLPLKTGVSGSGDDGGSTTTNNDPPAPQYDGENDYINSLLGSEYEIRQSHTTNSGSAMALEAFKITHVDDSYRSIDGFAKLRVGVNYSFLPFMAVTVGVSANALIEKVYGNGVADSLKQRFNTSKMYRDYTIGDKEQRMRVWPSVYAGLTIGKISSSNQPKP